MAHETVTKSKRFYCVSLVPDFCKTPVGSSVVVIPYNIKGEFITSEAVSKSVKTHGEPVFLHGRSFIPSVTGDAPGKLGGIKSGTFLKRVESNQFSSTKGSNGTQTIQESRFVWMNNQNTYGRVLERQGQAPRPRLTILGWEVPTAKEAAQAYRDKYSEPLHQFGGDAMDVGGKIGMGSAALGVAGAGVAATGVGLPVAGAMEVGAAAGGITAGAVGGTGLVVDSAATVGDMAADYLIDGKVPNAMSAAGDMALNAAENFVFKKIPGGEKLFERLFKKKDVPGKTPEPPKQTPPDKGKGNDDDGTDGGKVKQEQPKKEDKPAACCPKNKGPANKSATGPKPIHFGTGEEILFQLDFVLDGPIPVKWGRTYRSGSETEDWSVLGARWSLPFNAGVSVCAQGIVFHDDSGRPVRLPLLAVGDEYDCRSEGFVLRRESEQEFVQRWRNGTTDTFRIATLGILPHGFHGLNMMLKPGAPVRAQRYCLVRTAGPDGRGTSIERFNNVQPDQVMLRVRTDSGIVLEAMRAPLLTGEIVQGPRTASARIGRVEQLFADGTRVCHAKYAYAVAEAQPPDSSDLEEFDALPQRCYLVSQTDIGGAMQTYAYRSGLLSDYVTVDGFAYALEWISLASLRERWAGSQLDESALQQRYPIEFANSFSARAVRATTADGRNEVAIDYVDMDTSIVTESDGGKLAYTFDRNWLITEVKRIRPDGTSSSLGKREWDRDGKLLADIDASGAATRYAYDARGNLIQVTDALGHVTRMEYDANDRQIAEVDALGYRSTRAYDGNGNVIESVDALGHATRYHYDSQGQVVQVIDARGGIKRLEYDQNGQLIAFTDCSQLTHRYAYDRAGRLVELIDPQGKATTYRYDVRGELTGIAIQGGGTETFTFDAAGRLTEYRDEEGNPTRYMYNGHGLPVERIDAKGQIVRYVHDKALRVTELINGNQESYYLRYDEEGRLVGETGFDGKVSKYKYDRAGNLVERDINGVVTLYARDALGQIDAQVDPDGSVRFCYDPLGRLVGLKSSTAEQRFAFDPVGQLIDERVAYAISERAQDGERAFDAAFTLTHSYDELGNRIETVMPNGRRVQTQRYGSGHWHGTLWQGKSLVDVESDTLHREVERRIGTHATRMVATRSYDPQSRLNAVALRKGNQVLHDRSYVYGSAGNLLQVKDAQRGTTTYSYDPIGQLRSAIQPDSSEFFDFDPAGNILEPERETRAPHPHPGALEDMEEQPLPGAERPRLAKVTRNLLRSYLDYAYEYDLNGNAVVKRTRAYASANDAGLLTLTYDSENRIASATRQVGHATTTALYSYDALGRRIAKRVIETAADGMLETQDAAVTYYVWDGNRICQEISRQKTVSYLYEPGSFVPLALIESAHDAPSPEQRTHLRHVPGWELPPLVGDHTAQVAASREDTARLLEAAHLNDWQSIQAKALGDSEADRIYHFVCDHLGTPQQLFDDDGGLVWSVRYRAWGRVLREEVAMVSQPLRFQGQYEDAETGLYYNRYRYYDPDCARYLSADPIGLAGGRNLHQYVPSPTAYVDPLGLFANANYVYGLGGRIESATAVITPADLNTGSDTNPSSRRHARKLGCPLDDAGHVVGNRLGGKGGKKFVFPQSPGINRGRFRDFEADIANDVAAGNTAHLNINLVYKGASTRPDEIVYSYTVNGRTRTRTFLNPKNCP